jgi:hypothetical protein
LIPNVYDIFFSSHAVMVSSRCVLPPTVGSLCPWRALDEADVIVNPTVCLDTYFHNSEAGTATYKNVDSALKGHGFFFLCVPDSGKTDLQMK